MKLLSYLFLFVFISIPSFAQSENSYQKFLILDVSDKVPDSARFIKDIKVRGGMRNIINYADAVKEAMNKAGEAGGNIIKITEAVAPGHWNSGFGLRADIYYKDNISGLIETKEHQFEAEITHLVPDTAAYALLYVYRPAVSVGALIQFNLHADDSQICRVNNGGCFTIRLYKKGNTRLWARTESLMELNQDIQPGKVYFLKCKITMGYMVGEPDFDFIDPYYGYPEFKLCASKKERSEENEKEKDKPKEKEKHTGKDRYKDAE